MTKRPTAPKTTAATSGASAASTAKKSAAAIAATQKREEQRKKLMEMKRKNKMAIAADSVDIICAPELPTTILEQRNGKNAVENRDGQPNETNETDRWF